MEQQKYILLENYMFECMDHSAHDREHIYRVLYHALDIAQTEEFVNYDVLICSCLLHDIGRQEQFENPTLCHAKIGAQKACNFLSSNGFSPDFIDQVTHCIKTHRFRKDNPPQSLEAKILFDSDKLDVSGVTGIARTLLYKGQIMEPLYSLLPNGFVSNGENDTRPSFFQEYKYKLEKIYSFFYTKRGQELAKSRQKSAISFYENLLQEVTTTYLHGQTELTKFIQ